MIKLGFLGVIAVIPEPFNYISLIIISIIAFLGVFTWCMKTVCTKELRQGDILSYQIAKIENGNIPEELHYEDLETMPVEHFNKIKPSAPAPSVTKRPLPMPPAPDIPPLLPSRSTFRDNRFTRSIGLSVRLPKYFRAEYSTTAPKLGPKPQVTLTNDRVVIVTTGGAWTGKQQNAGKSEGEESDCYVPMCYSKPAVK